MNLFEHTLACVSLFSKPPKKFFTKRTKSWLSKKFCYKFMAVYIMSSANNKKKNNMRNSKLNAISTIEMLLNDDIRIIMIIYFWCLTAPRRFVMLRTRVFVLCGTKAL